MNLVDMVLARDPQAVIVLQADHGLHLVQKERMMSDLSITEEELDHLYNGVFSAVRIPEPYGKLDAPLAPLNISRELVNRFVGENYDYLEIKDDG